VPITFGFLLTLSHTTFVLSSYHRGGIISIVPQPSHRSTRSGVQYYYSAAEPQVLIDPSACAATGPLKLFLSASWNSVINLTLWCRSFQSSLQHSPHVRSSLQYLRGTHSLNFLSTVSYQARYLCLCATSRDKSDCPLDLTTTCNNPCCSILSSNSEPHGVLSFHTTKMSYLLRFGTA
jgi:hypothetical protein